MSAADSGLKGRQAETIRVAKRAIGVMRGSDPEAEEALKAVVEDNRPLLYRQLRYLRPSPGQDWDDIQQTVDLGVVRAVQLYDETRGRFSTALVVVGCGTLLHEIEVHGRIVRVPRYIFNRRRQAARGRPQRPYDTAAVECALKPTAGPEFLADVAAPGEDPAAVVETAELAQRFRGEVEAELGRLSDPNGKAEHEAVVSAREADIVARHLGLRGYEVTTMPVIARTVGLTSSGAWWAYRRGIEKLRNALEDRWG